MRIGGNIQGLRIANRLTESQASISRALQRLSSGKRINSPRDNLADFSTLQGLESQTRGIRQSLLNLNSHRSILEVGSSAIQTQREIVLQIRDIAIRASSGVLNSSDRSALNEELLSLRTEFDRIANSTEVNSFDLLRTSQSFDLDLDGFGRLTTTTESSSSQDNFKKSIGSFRFTEETITDFQDTTSVEATTGDFNGDGRIDLASIGFSLSEVLLNNGGGSFQSFNFARPTNAAAVESMDFNKDGLDDLIFGTTSGVVVYLSRGDGTFTKGATLTTDSASSGLKLQDLNNDNIFDLIISTSDSLTTFINDGSNQFLEQSNLSATVVDPLEASFEFGDFDQDGSVDIVYTNTDDDTGENYIYLSLGNGDGTFGSFACFATATGNEELRLVAQDFNGDGQLDLLYGSIELLLFIGDGQGAFASPVTIASSNNESDFDTGDIDFDGDLDLVSGGTVYENDGLGNFSTRSTILFSNTAFNSNLFLKDFDGDQILDVIGVNYGDNNFQFMLGGNQLVSTISDLNVDDEENASDLIRIADRALDYLNSKEARLGIQIGRLDQVRSILERTNETLTDSQSQIQDADFAQETAELVRAQILQQAQIAALSQSNLQSQLILNLLEANLG